MIFALAAQASAFSISPGGQPTPVMRRGAASSSAAGPQMMSLETAWKEFVLLRPDWESPGANLKDSTKLRTAKAWSWDERTPGTARTLLISSVLVAFFAIPAIMANPVVLTKVLELAALDVIGETPADVLSKTGTYLP